MNERIKKLAEQAKLIASEYNGFDRTTITKAEQKFAELIIQECIDICLRNHIDNTETISAGECAYDIQEHFGVD